MKLQNCLFGAQYVNIKGEEWIASQQITWNK